MGRHAPTSGHVHRDRLALSHRGTGSTPAEPGVDHAGKGARSGRGEDGGARGGVEHGAVVAARSARHHPDPAALHRRVELDLTGIGKGPGLAGLAGLQAQPRDVARVPGLTAPFHVQTSRSEPTVGWANVAPGGSPALCGVSHVEEAPVRRSTFSICWAPTVAPTSPHRASVKPPWRGVVRSKNPLRRGPHLLRSHVLQGRPPS